MRFEVPQFIDVEDKIFGPLTFKQFIYLLGGGGLAYVSYKVIPSPVSYLVALAFIVLGLLLAFYKLNNRTFIEIAQAWLTYSIKGKLYIWKRSPPKQSPQKPIIPISPVAQNPVYNITEKKLNDLSQNLDILDS